MFRPYTENTIPGKYSAFHIPHHQVHNLQPFQTYSLNKLPPPTESKEEPNNSSESDMDEIDEMDETKSEESISLENNKMNRLTFDLMVNHKYLAKHNNVVIQQRQKLHEKIIKHKKDILKSVQECLHFIEKGDSDPLYKTHWLEGFEEFAKQVILDIEHSKLPEADEMFS